MADIFDIRTLIQNTTNTVVIDKLEADVDTYKGEPGYTPVKGTDYEDGEDGIPGKSAYELAFEVDSTIGTNTDWLESLKGEQGDTIIGPKGLPGNSVYKIKYEGTVDTVNGGYINGAEAGKTGQLDEYGAYGDNEEFQFMSSFRVYNGADGISMLSGEGTPASTLGVNGHTYYDNVNFIFYYKKNDVWEENADLPAMVEEVVAANADAVAAMTAAGDAIANSRTAESRNSAAEDEIVQVWTFDINDGHHTDEAAYSHVDSDPIEYSTYHWEQKAVTAETNATAAKNTSVNAKDAAETAQGLAEAAQLAAETIYDTYDDRFLGSFNEDPTEDNDGDTLAVGSTYWHTDDESLKFYNGSVWEDPVTDAVSSATTAVDAKDITVSAKDDAVDAKDIAETAKTDAETARDEAQSSKDAAQTSEAKANKWAAEVEDTEVETDKYSGLHYAAKASASATSATEDATSATSSEAMATEWASKEEDAEITDNAGKYSALHYATKTIASASAASDSENASAASESNAANSETIAVDSATAANTNRWEAKAAQATADSYAMEAEDVVVKVWSVNTAEDGIESVDTDPAEYSAIHWANKSEGTLEAANTQLSANQNSIAINAQAIANMGTAQAVVTGAVMDPILTDWTKLDYTIVGDSTDTDILELDDTADTITFKKNASYNLHQSLMVEALSAQSRDLEFRIITVGASKLADGTDVADGTVVVSKTKTLENALGDTESLEILGLLTVGKNGMPAAPVTMRLELRQVEEDYKLLAFDSVIASSSSYDLSVSIVHSDTLGRESADSHPASAIATSGTLDGADYESVQELINIITNNNGIEVE